MQVYTEDLTSKRYASVDQARMVLPRLFAYLKKEGIRDVRAVSETHLTAYLRGLCRQRSQYGRPLAVATRLIYIAVVRRFFAFLDKRSVILRNPALHLRYPRRPVIPRGVLTEAEAVRLMETPPDSTRGGPRDRAILETLYGTGIRIGECGRIDVSDLDLSQGQLLVRDGKGRKDRVVPVAGRAAAALAVYLRDIRPALVHDPMEAALFLSHFGTRLKKGTLYVLVKNHARTARLKVSPHGLRHACATHLLARGADLRHIQALLGHSFIDTTALYTRVNTSGLREVLDRAHPRGKLE
jgi:integrase/recombinase XerD